ncbi:MAG: rubrerythrin [candidate division WOR-3 bacterium]|nr:MAG: rubrerythrin [candidate division WOR-3 bacterium]
MISRTLMNLERLSKKDLAKEILKICIMTELNSVNLYEQLSALTTNENIKQVLRDYAGAMKVHVETLYDMLSEYNKMQKREKLIKDKKINSLFLWNMF